MAGGFGNKKVEKKKSSNTKDSTQKNNAPLEPKASALANPAAQKAMLDVKQIVDSLDENEDPFWQLIEPLLLSEYNAEDIQRVLGFIKYSTGKLPLPDSIVQDKWRPHEDIHAFMVPQPLLHSACPSPPHGILLSVLLTGRTPLSFAGRDPRRAIPRQDLVPLRC
jgi:hypothetical protein